MLSPETQEQIKNWQIKIADGSITTEELKAAMAYLRTQRTKAFYPAKEEKPVKAEKAPKAEKEAPIDGAALFASLFGPKEN